MRMYNRIKSRGFTLVELMIVVAIIGVLAALAIYGVRQYLISAKTAEAKEGVGRIAKDASSAYDREGMAGTVLNLTGTAGVTHRLCFSATAMVPAAPASIQGQKYQSSPAEWAPVADAADEGFKCLNFSMKDPQYFMYNYFTAATTPAQAGALAATFNATAYGDLNGDTNTSSFVLSGTIQQAASGGLVLTVAPNFVETNSQE